VTHFGATERDPVVALGEAAQAVETRMRAAGPNIGRHYAWFQSLIRSARALGANETLLFGADEAQTVTVWMLAAQAWGKSIRAMDQGRAELQPWRIGNGPIAFAVRALNGETGELGWWGVALKVLQVASAAAVAGFAWLINDSYQMTEQLEAQGELARVKALARLVELQGADPRAAAKITTALARADSDSAAGASSWLDKLAGGAGAGLGGAAIAFGLFWLMGRRKGRR
jgi:hypothetical protein